jgi:hypothetical protein
MELDIEWKRILRQRLGKCFSGIGCTVTVEMS